MRKSPLGLDEQLLAEGETACRGVGELKMTLWYIIEKQNGGVREHGRVECQEEWEACLYLRQFAAKSTDTVKIFYSAAPGAENQGKLRTAKLAD